jgi:hypothetical protein
LDKAKYLDRSVRAHSCCSDRSMDGLAPLNTTQPPPTKIAPAPRDLICAYASYPEPAGGQLVLSDDPERLFASILPHDGHVRAGDVKALKEFEIQPYSSSPKAMDRYGNQAVIALEAWAKAAR